MRPPTANPVTQAKHGNFNAVDYSYRPDPVIYAPEDGIVSFYGVAGDCGNNLQVQSGNRRHGFCHLESVSVAVGQAVKKGQPIGVMGFTGKTIPTGPNGRHLHWVLKVDNKYVYPPSLVTEPFKGVNMSKTEAEWANDVAFRDRIIEELRADVKRVIAEQDAGFKLRDRIISELRRDVELLRSDQSGTVLKKGKYIVP